MRSINVKRVAAIAAGAAMVGSTLATGLAAVQTSGDVTSFIQTIKANLDDVEVVVGTNGAAISDGVQAAKLAAVLATLNYEEATGVATVPDTSGVTIGEKTVTLQASGVAGTQEQLTSDLYAAKMDRAAGGVNGGFGTAYKNFTITPDMLPNVLTSKEFTAYVGGQSQKYQYREVIRLGYNAGAGLRAVYAEQSNPAGHGLYLYAPYGTILYRLDFTQSNGFPLNVTYSSIPEITMLGQSYAIDTTNSANGRLSLYSGERTSMSAGDEITTDDGYTVKLENVGIIGGNNVAPTFTITSPSGEQDSRQISVQSSFKFFDGTVTLYVESAAQGAYIGTNQATGTATVRIGSQAVDLVDNTAFPLDDAWTVSRVSVTSNALQYVDIKYGSVNDVTSANFQGTVQTGLNEGTVINGPLNSEGNTVFSLQLAGLKQEDNTDVTFTGLGSGTDDLMQASWYSRDGQLQSFEPSSTLLTDIATGAGDDVTLQVSGATLVNDKSVYFKGIDTTTSGGGTQTRLRFAVGSQTNELPLTTPLDSSNQTTLNYASLTNPVTCTITYDATQGTIDITNAGALTYDSTTAGCDLYPDVVGIGSTITIDQGSSLNPYIDLSGITGGTVGYTGVTTEVLPYAYVVEPTQTQNILVVYDSQTSGIDQYTGIEAYNATTTATNASTAYRYVDQAVANVYENNQYDMTMLGTVIDGGAQNVLKVNVAKKARDVILKIAGELTETDTGSSATTVGEGGTVGGVTVNAINAELEGIDTITCGAAEGTLYSKVSAMDPTDLVTTDNAISKSYHLVVGGPFVNTIAQLIDSEGTTTTGAGAQYLIVSDDDTKLLAAGYLASDSVAAIDYLIDLLQA